MVSRFIFSTFKTGINVLIENKETNIIGMFWNRPICIKVTSKKSKKPVLPKNLDVRVLWYYCTLVKKWEVILLFCFARNADCSLVMLCTALLWSTWNTQRSQFVGYWILSSWAIEGNYITVDRRQSQIVGMTEVKVNTAHKMIDKSTSHLSVWTLLLCPNLNTTSIGSMLVNKRSVLRSPVFQRDRKCETKYIHEIGTSCLHK